MTTARLQRTVGLPGAVWLGLGSMLGTGVFVALALGVERAGRAALVAVPLAGALAMANGLSSAQLAAAHPVAGGTYVYAGARLGPLAGFVAGIFFLAAKGASAATAALGVERYLQDLGVPLAIPVAPIVSATVTGIVLLGLRRTTRVNIVLVTITVATLAALVLAAAVRITPSATPAAGAASWRDVLEVTALIFVAYTGYGRIATLGEEIRDPRHSIPRAIIATVIVTALLYAAVTWILLRSGVVLGTDGAPLVEVARRTGASGLVAIVHVGAFAALIGVTLNLILGLSRVVVAMARHRDLPHRLARLDGTRTTPPAAVVVTGVVVTALTLIGDIGLTWSFSAFTVLVYYGLTNASALRLTRGERFAPRVIAWAGLLGCLSLAWFVETRVWIAGAVLLGVTVAWFLVNRSWRARSADRRR